ncbi:hypothetical protein JTB14_006914 [Gonioctena quinquepunctata]|nr:hypothetical protein JTB14_006914 [Gonioctena quinquepunctata]
MCLHMYWNMCPKFVEMESAQVPTTKMCQPTVGHNMCHIQRPRNVGLLLIFHQEKMVSDISWFSQFAALQCLVKIQNHLQSFYFCGNGWGILRTTKKANTTKIEDNKSDSEGEYHSLMRGLLLQSGYENFE